MHDELMLFALLDRMWMEDGYFCREPGLREMKFAFTNYGVSVELQAADAMPALEGRHDLRRTPRLQ